MQNGLLSTADKKVQKPLVQPEEFEKDDDENGHIDFIYALANCRARNYGLEPMDWLQVSSFGRE